MKRDNYVEYRNYIKREEFSKEFHPLLKTLDDYYKNNNGDLSLDDYYNLFFADNRHELDLYKQIFQALETKQELESTRKLLESFKTQRLAEEISIAAYEVAEGKKSLDHLKELTSQLDSPAIEEELSFVTDDVDAVMDGAYKVPGLRWRLKWLNESLGSLRKGNFGFIFARPETGKTAFVVSEATFMCSQLKPEDGPVLHFNNEEVGLNVQARIFMAALGATSAQINEHRARAKEKYFEITKGKYKLVDGTFTKWDIEKYCEKYKPSLIIIDQLDKVDGFKADRHDLQLGEIYIWARNLAKKFCPVIGVCQADGTAEGREFLTMAEVANSKTSKSAEADWIVGIGLKTEAGYEHVRYLSIPKNKLVGDADTDPKQRHGRKAVFIKPEIMRYVDNYGD